MNKAKLKTYAPQARKDFIAAVTARAHRLGLSDNNGQLQITPAEKSGDLVIIAGQSWPAKISRQRDNLIGLMHKHGFAQTLENVAYTWFNRFAALRYMEIHDYLNHGYRVLSSREGGLPEILGHAPELAQNGDLPGLNPQRAIELKLAGDQDGELYRLTLIAQCNALSNAIPFLFEKIDDETELLLPDNLLLTDSVIAKLVDAIPEEDWSQVEIIGWLYQFYISEKKDQVIGKVVKSEDIPAATQLFTPNWIVQYLVQNSIGRLWLMANPTSSLKSQWPYYIEPAEQTPAVQAQLDALIQTRLSEDSTLPEGEGPVVRGTLNPETITVLDPACGSGHILVEAYEVLKAIYLERGYQARSIPRLILEKNLYGLDIDDRAAQMAGFALLMKARADDRRLLDNPPKLNVLALQESKGLDADELVSNLAGFVGWVRPQQSEGRNPTNGADSASKSNMLGYAALTQPTIESLLDTFAHAKTFGSLIQIPSDLNAQLPAMDEALQQAIQSGDLFTQAAAFDLLPLVQQAQILGMQFDAVVANPPYMGAGAMNKQLKSFCSARYPEYKLDLYSAFMKSLYERCANSGIVCTIVMHSWMFVLKFEAMRNDILRNYELISMLHLGTRAFEELSGEVVQTVAFCAAKKHFGGNYRGTYIRLVDGSGGEKKAAFVNKQAVSYLKTQYSFATLPGSILCYWASDDEIMELTSGNCISNYGQARHGLVTSDNNRFLRFWWEVSRSNIDIGCATALAAVDSKKKWFPYNKGGTYRKWFGNNDLIVNWFNDGEEIVKLAKDMYGSPSKKVTSREYYFKSGLTWSALSSDNISMRANGPGYLFDSKGSSAFFQNDDDTYFFLLYLNSRIATRYLNLLCPTLDYNAGSIAKVPVPSCDQDDRLRVIALSKEVINLAQKDWNCQVQSLGFFNENWFVDGNSIESSFRLFNLFRSEIKQKTKELVAEAEQLFLKYVRVNQQELGGVDDRDFCLPMASLESFSIDFLEYAIGCMMGRYSLDEPGLIYAHAGNVDFDPARYNTFPADADGIVPITDELWFEDDAANRIREFLLAVWGAETLDENLAWLAESLGQKTNETPEETIRRYLAGSFFKDHLQTYKKRPIYWLFSSGKQGAFQALVYLHRYHEGTLARMRAEYVVPLTGKIQSRIEMLKKDAAAAASNAARNKLNKDIEKLNKKHVELLAYDEKLRHYADLRIHLDLDDGVKVNYGKFGDLLAEVKAVTGGAADD